MASYNDAAELIDRSKILISGHARSQFMDRVNEVYEFYRKLGKAERKIRWNKIGGVPFITSYEEAERWIRDLLNRATAQNAVTKTHSVYEVLDYLKTGERTYFLHTGRWQFVIAQDADSPDHYILKTAIWLDKHKYERMKS